MNIEEQWEYDEALSEIERHHSDFQSIRDEVDTVEKARAAWSVELINEFLRRIRNIVG